ncbi:hypothetical protein L1887_18864 [Cichorium endivia]|nr:hypothetical protein L1887_18864 [Cichorium endivia]
MVCVRVKDAGEDRRRRRCRRRRRPRQIDGSSDGVRLCAVGVIAGRKGLRGVKGLIVVSILRLLTLYQINEKDGELNDSLVRYEVHRKMEWRDREHRSRKEDQESCRVPKRSVEAINKTD